MKCQLCKEKKGSTRCEGCDISLCLSCMNKHHDELLQQFQQLLNNRNELKESLDTIGMTSQNENEITCLIEINQWERKTIECIREITRKVRVNITEIMSKNVVEVHHQLDQLSVNMQQQEKEGNYLENDIREIQQKLSKLKEIIQDVNRKIQVTMSNDVNWDALIHVTTDKNLGENSDSFNQQKNLETDFQNNQEKPSNRKSTIQYPSPQQSAFHPAAPLQLQQNNTNSFRPISPAFPTQNDCSASETNVQLRSNVEPFDQTNRRFSNQIYLSSGQQRQKLDKKPHD